MAFQRSVARAMGRGLDRTDASLHMRKWWNMAYHRQDGLITQTLSPFEQHIITPFFHDVDERAMRLIKRWTWQILPSLLMAAYTVQWADHEYEKKHKEHWD